MEFGKKKCKETAKDSDSNPAGYPAIIIVSDMTGRNMDLDKYIALSEKEITDGKIIPKSKLLSSERIKKNDAECQRMIVTGTIDRPVKLEIYCWFSSPMAFVLIFVAEEKKFDQFKEQAEDILDSFHFAGPL